MERSDVEPILVEAIEAAEDGDEDEAWAVLEPLIGAADVSAAAAWGVAVAAALGELDPDRRVELARRVFDRWPDDVAVAVALGQATETLHDVRYLNDAPPSDPFFEAVARRLARALDEATTDEARAMIARGLTTSARVCGRAFDALTEAGHRALLAREPDRWETHYNIGLFYKNRGRFREGLEANQRAAALGGADDEAVSWNLAICATAVGEGAAALAEWRKLGLDIDVGPGGWPEGSFPTVQVRLAERPVAERTAEDDTPGREETIWVERLSPCHGRVRSALHQELGVDYGDVVLFDGAPIVIRTWEDRSVPVFPHLATLARGGFAIHRFAATQPEKHRVAEAGDRLGEGALLYVLTEQFQVLCPTCWEQPDAPHRHEDETHHVVVGKLVFPDQRPAGDIGSALDALVAEDPSLRIYVPGLWRQVGDLRRAEVEERRRAMLLSGLPAGAAPPS
ncbi:MAG: prenyltransferase [Sandaracinaceae bacterium]